MDNQPPGQPPGPPPSWSPPPQPEQPPQYQPPQEPSPQPQAPPQYQPPSGPSQPQYQPPNYQGSSGSGLDKKTGSILAYVLGWVTGVIFLFVGRSDADVRFHAAQSIVFFGGMTVVFWVLDFLRSIVGLGAFDVLVALVQFVLGIFTFVVWIICLMRASQGGGARFSIPLVGDLVTPWAQQLADAVA